MTPRNNQQGLAALEGLLILVVLAIIGLVGWRVVSTRQSVDKISSQLETQKLAVPKTSSLPEVKSASDLDKAQKSLDAENPDDSNGDLNQVDKELGSL